MERLLQRYHQGNSGYRTTIISIPLFHCIYFPIYGSVKKRLHHEYKCSQGLSVLGASFVAGCSSNIISNPLWVPVSAIQVVRTRVMVQILRPAHERYEKTSAWQVLNRIVKEVRLSLRRKDSQHCSEVSVPQCLACCMRVFTSPSTNG